MKTLIILEPRRGFEDQKLLCYLRTMKWQFSTGMYENTIFDPYETQCCLWYMVDADIDDIKILYDLVHCHYKAATVYNNQCVFVECNCADMDLPMIEDVYKWLVDKNKSDI